MWKDIKRLKGKHPGDGKGDKTHICVVRLTGDAPDGSPRFCNELLTLHKNNPKKAGAVKSWITTKAADHLRDEHPVDSEAGQEASQRAEKKAEEKMENALDFGMPDEHGNDIDSISKWKLSKREKSLNSQAQWYVYSSMKISKSEFDSIWFKNMLKETGDGEKTAILTPTLLKQHIAAEWAVFLLFLKIIASAKVAEALGNRFAQALHDGGTLANKKKYQALALQFIAPGFKKNLVITLAFTRSVHNKDGDVASLFDGLCKKRTGYALKELAGRMRSDRAAKGVAKAAGMEEMEVCEMHDTDKLGRAATGALVRTRGGKAVNPFEAGVKLVARAHAVGAYFGYSTRHDDLMKMGAQIGNCANIRIKVDYNTTRIASVHGLMFSMLRLQRPLKGYEVQHVPKWDLKIEDWSTMAEFEAVLNATRVTSTLSQIEKDYMAAFTMLIKSLCMKKLRAATLDVIDADRVGASPRVARRSVDVADLSEHGNTARVRALLEGERRWCGNTTEGVLNLPIEMGRHELLAMVLDKRTLAASHVTSEQRAKALTVFEEEYVVFSKTANEYEKACALKRREEADAEEEEVEVKPEPSASTQTSSLASGDVYDAEMKWSDDEDEDEDACREVDAEQAAQDEARRALKAWKKFKVEWLELYPALKEHRAKEMRDKEPLDLTSDLMRLDIGKLYNEVGRSDQGRRTYGFIPLMASCSIGQLGALSAESYCERVISCANNVMNDGNTLLNDAELEQLVVLRMNCEFMQFMRKNYGAQAKDEAAKASQAAGPSSAGEK